MDWVDETRRATIAASDRIEDVAIDRWLKQSLRERYAATLREPVPEALTKLLLPPSGGR